jgi:hypothetical protein
MKDRISAHAPRTASTLRDIVQSVLSYKIAVKDERFVEQFPDTFELGRCEYGSAVDSFLEHNLVGNFGASEISTVTRNGDFLKIFDACCGFRVYRDQTDPSSVVLTRPDDTVVCRGAVCLTNQAKADSSLAATALKELTDNLSPDAVRVFPANWQSIFGMTTFPNLIIVYEIGLGPVAGTYSTTEISSYDVRHLHQRVDFIKTVFKISEWMLSISGPNDNFHLVPGVRTRTPNGHHITWTKDCLLKELKMARAGTTKLQALMGRLEQIYAARLANVEWGMVKAPNFLQITRVGCRLRNALVSRKITAQKAVEDVRLGKQLAVNIAYWPFCNLPLSTIHMAGVHQLHALGLAHTDIKVDNVFVDTSGVAFLDDLEYVVPVASPARSEGKGFRSAEQTAQEQDEAQLVLLQAEVLNL